MLPVFVKLTFGPLCAMSTWLLVALFPPFPATPISSLFLTELPEPNFKRENCHQGRAMGAGHMGAVGDQREEKLSTCPVDALVHALLSWPAAFLFPTLALVSATWVSQQG